MVTKKHPSKQKWTFVTSSILSFSIASKALSKDELEVAKSNIPKSWDESILEIKNKYKLK